MTEGERRGSWSTVRLSSVQAAGLFVAALGAAKPAYCAEALREPPSYRAPMVAADVLGIGLMLAGAARNDAPLGVYSFVGYAASGPIVHWLNGEGARGFASLGLRVGAPVLGAVIGASFPRGCGNCGGESMGLAPAVPGMLIGAAAGALVASAIDIGFLARRDLTASLEPGPITWAVGATSVAMSARF